MIFCLKKIPILRAILEYAEHKPTLQRTRFTGLKEFANYTKKISALTCRLSKKTFFLEIARPAHNLVINCCDFSRVVADYNDVFRNISELAEKNVIYPFQGKDPSDLLLDDGHHLNINGHRRVYDACKGVIAA